MDLGLKDKAVIVTGGASNIGKAIANVFAEEGALVAVFDRDEAMANRTVGEITGRGHTAVAYDVDLTDVEATQHPRDGETPDVRIDESDRKALVSDSDGEVHAERRLTDPTLAGTHRDHPSERAHHRRLGVLFPAAGRHDLETRQP